ncbi:hypothetical protein N7495_002226 [Penicillium taxi]|uniref:uncharacterized protein n=1 Tax=Penicillium taxi TaxID=168475 RepID=UPI0025454338|nr:uncharacterized protein N7495_002226 [Penicillium taxi]KAJ5901698.1 hypothetical protein N7495_002226 [Penicillium taxi]
MLQTWMISYREIQNRAPNAAELLLLLAYFDNRDIWYELVQSASNSLNVPDWLQEIILSELTFKDSVKPLIEFSLIETKQQEGSYAIHPVSDVQFLVQAKGIIQSVSDGLFHMQISFFVYMGAFHGLGDLYSDQGKLKEAEEMYQRALAGKEKALGPDHTSTLTTVNNLSLLYSDQGKLKDAEDSYQGELPDSQKVSRLNSKRARQAIAKFTRWLK